MGWPNMWWSISNTLIWLYCKMKELNEGVSLKWLRRIKKCNFFQVKIEKLHITGCECFYTILTKQVNNIISFKKEKDIGNHIKKKKSLSQQNPI